MNQITDGHTVERYNTELSNLHQLVMKMGGMVRDQMSRAVKTLEDEDVDEARLVVQRDRETRRHPARQPLEAPAGRARQYAMTLLIR